MQLDVRLFARAKDLAGAESVSVDLTDGAAVSDLKVALASQYPTLEPIVAHLLVAIGTDYADDSTELNASSQVSCFPPVSGG